MEIKNVQKTENTDDDRQTSSRLNTSIGRQDVGSSVRPNVTLLRPKTAMAALGTERFLYNNDIYIRV